MTANSWKPKQPSCSPQTNQIIKTMPEFATYNAQVNYPPFRPEKFR